MTQGSGVAIQKAAGVGVSSASHHRSRCSRPASRLPVAACDHQAWRSPSLRASSLGPDNLDPCYLPCGDVQRIAERLAEDSRLLVDLDRFL